MRELHLPEDPNRYFAKVAEATRDVVSKEEPDSTLADDPEQVMEIWRDEFGDQIEQLIPEAREESLNLLVNALVHPDADVREIAAGKVPGYFALYGQNGERGAANHAATGYLEQIITVDEFGDVKATFLDTLGGGKGLGESDDVLLDYPEAFDSILDSLVVDPDFEIRTHARRIRHETENLLAGNDSPPK